MSIKELRIKRQGRRQRQLTPQQRLARRRRLESRKGGA